jgi:hypothetical protein
MPVICEAYVNVSRVSKGELPEFLVGTCKEIDMMSVPVLFVPKLGGREVS